MKDYRVTSKTDQFIYFFVSADSIIERPDHYIYFRCNGRIICGVDINKFSYEVI